MTYTGLKGGGEANFCNAMWHGRPIVAADSIAASDYVVDGQTGYVVPSGDWRALRQRIVELWRHPEQRERMGDAGRRRAEDHFTHVKCIRRLLRLALLMGGTDAANP
jgi:glycosyltransferase involved in cell wall biosynthesis